MIPVFLDHASDYIQAAQTVRTLLKAILPPPRGLRILLKPNFVSLRHAGLACTHARIIAAAAEYCQDLGARVTVGDSPAFGTAERIAREIGLTGLLVPLNVPVMTLNRGVRVQSGNVTIPVSTRALQADLILNLPKFKAHSQMRFSGAVKNLFGCVPGVHKAWLHARHGDKGARFTEMIRGLQAVLPPTVSLLDGVEAMHRTGPIMGEKFDLGFLGASVDSAALDTAAGLALGAKAEMFPIWMECLRAGLPGADPGQLAFPLLQPSEFDTKGFILPATLKPESFRPDVLAKSLTKRLWMSWRKN